MTIEHYLIGRLAEAMFDGGKEQRERVGVGCVIRNRVLAGSDWYSEITKCNNLLPGSDRDPAFLKCLWAAEEVFYGRQYDETGGALCWSYLPQSNSTKIDALYFTVEESGGGLRASNTTVSLVSGSLDSQK